MHHSRSKENAELQRRMNHSKELELSRKLRELTLTLKRASTELREKKVEAEKINCNIIEKKRILDTLNEQIRKIKEKRERARIAQNEPVLDRNSVEITIDYTIEVINGYNKFSKTLPNSRQSRGQLFSGQYIQNYDIDRFVQVTYIQITGHLGKLAIKVHFVTDSVFETWRIAKNVAVYVAKNVTA